MTLVDAPCRIFGLGLLYRVDPLALDGKLLVLIFPSTCFFQLSDGSLSHASISSRSSEKTLGGRMIMSLVKGERP